VKEGGFVYGTPEALFVSENPPSNASMRGVLMPCLAMDDVATANQSICASLIGAEHPMFFVRVYNGTYLELDPDFNPRDPGNFDNEASYFLRPSEYFPDYNTFEPLSHPDHRWISDGERLLIGAVDNTEEFQNKASIANFDHSIERTSTRALTY